MEMFEVHITGDNTIIENASKLNIKTIVVNLLRPTKEFFRSEAMTSFVVKFETFELCKKHVDQIVDKLKKMGTIIYREKIESPLYEHYTERSLYMESHFTAINDQYPISQNARKTTYLATDRVYDKNQYSAFAEKYKDKELELCLHDTNPTEDSDWFNLYKQK